MPTLASQRWLAAACWGCLLFGAAMLLLPGLTRAGFGWLMLNDVTAIEGWPPAARGYVTLLHGVLGAVMVGWAVALLLMMRPAPLPAWRIVGFSAAAWFVSDTLHSALLGAWPNVALNTAFAAAFAPGLWLCWRSSGGRRL